MERKLYRTPGEFLEDNRSFLEENEAVVQLNYGNASSNREKDCHPGLLFGRYEEDGRMLLLFGHTQPWNVCLDAPQGDERSMQAAAELATYLREENVEITGVNAREELAQAFMQAYGGRFRLRTGMDIMVLKDLIEPPAVPCSIRRAGAADTDLVLEWLCGLFWDIDHRESTPSEYEHWRPRVENGQVYLCVDPQGVPVSMATAIRDLPRGISVGGVYTPPEYRGRGYCQNTVATLCREKLAAGREYCTLFVDKANPISNRVYEKIGFVVVEDNFDYRVVK